jgi:hypothetical protein
MAAPISKFCETTRTPGLDLPSMNFAKCRGHCLAVMRYKDSSRFRGDTKYLRVSQPNHAALPRSQEIYTWLSPSKANDDLVVEIGVRLKSRSHARGAWVRCRASSSL